MEYQTYTPQIVFITGATGGFGVAMAKRFAAAGSKLILHGRDQDKLDKLNAELNAQTHTLCFDITKKEQITNAISSIPADFKNIDLLINNAGGALGLDKFQDADLEDLENMIAMNNTSLIQISHQVIDIMVGNKKGHIINIGSIAGNWPYPAGHVYCAVKAFVKQFSLALRADLNGTNVRVSNIEPGMVETAFSLKRFKGDIEKANAVYANTDPLTAADIAETIFWTACLPVHVNINTLEIMPTKQSFSPLSVEREV